MSTDKPGASFSFFSKVLCYTADRFPYWPNELVENMTGLSLEQGREECQGRLVGGPTPEFVVLLTASYPRLRRRDCENSSHSYFNHFPTSEIYSQSIAACFIIITTLIDLLQHPRHSHSSDVLCLLLYLRLLTSPRPSSHNYSVLLS